jgi:hypothetical protein
MNDTQILELFRIVTQALERNTEALGKIEAVIKEDADATHKMSVEVKGMRKTIALAQQKVGVELGGVINESKRTLGKLNAEREEVRDAGSQATERRSPT